MSTPEETLRLHLAAAFEDFHHNQNGKVPPVNMREMHLVGVLRDIADGSILKKDVVRRATEVLELWDALRGD